MGVLKSKRAIKLFLIVILAIFSIGLIAVSLPKAKTVYAADGDSLIVFIDKTDFFYEEWNKSSFNPISEVIFNPGEDGADPEILSSYSITLTNTQTHATYTANVTNNNPSWSQLPSYAGFYSVSVTARGVTDTDSNDLTLNAKVLMNIRSGMSLSFLYEGIEYYNLSSQIDIKDYIEIQESNHGGLPQSIESYNIGYEWTHYFDSVRSAGDYPIRFFLVDSLSQEIPYIKYRTLDQANDSNLMNFVIRRRALLLDRAIFEGGSLISGALALENEKRYDGTPSAEDLGRLYSIGQDLDKYDYLIESTKITLGAEQGGLLAEDLDDMKSNSYIFNADWVTFTDSCFINEYGSPDGSLSPKNQYGEFIYDKSILFRFSLNENVVPQLRSYYIVVSDGEGGYVGSPAAPYAEIVLPEARILPSDVTININAHTAQYGFRINELNYQLATSQSGVGAGRIGIIYSGNLMGKTIGFYQQGSADIQIDVKIGSVFREGIDDPMLVDFIGKSISDTELRLKNYNRYTPLVGSYYHYVHIYYHGEKIEVQNFEDTYLCGEVNIIFKANSLDVIPIQLNIPTGLEIEPTKVYDGLLQANHSEYTFDDQWITDIYYIDAMQIEYDAADYLNIRVRPVFNSANAGSGKTITVSFVMELIQPGTSADYLINQYLPPSSYEIHDAVIHKKQIKFNFDMTNSQEAPLIHPELFPDGRMLIFEKAFKSSLPIIRQILFDPVYDPEGNVIMEEYYMLKPQLDEMGNVVYDFYGNVVYIEDTTRKYTRPKSNSNFILNENPYIEGYQPSGFEWASAIDLYYYCFEELYPPGHEKAGRQKSIEVTHFYFNPNTGEYELVIINEATPGAVRREINEYTPPAVNPGITINLKAFDCENYEFVPDDQYRIAFLQINKEIPEWDFSPNRNVTYNGRRHSSMLEDQDDDSYQDFLQINLYGHQDWEEIIGENGLGININVLEYCPYWESQTLPISEYGYQEQIRLITLAGNYLIEVSLPETSNCQASQPELIYLTISPAVLNVYLSPSKKVFGEPNPPDTPMPYKEDTQDTSQWGWRMYSSNYQQFFCTVLYQGFLNQDTPDNMSFGVFEHVKIYYGNIVETEEHPAWPGEYSIFAMDGAAHNYSFNLSPTYDAIFTIIPVKAVIQVTKEEIDVIYDPDKTAWAMQEEGEEPNPLAAFIYTAIDDSVVQSAVVGWCPIDGDFDISRHIFYRKNELGEYILDENGERIPEFKPVIVKVGGEWIPDDNEEIEEYEQKIDVRPPKDYLNAKNVGQYAIMLYANPNPDYYYAPTSKFITFRIGYAETQVTVADETIVQIYDGNIFRINGINNDLNNFSINNPEIGVYIQVEMKNALGEYEIILTRRLFDNSMDTRIVNAGEYRVTFTLEYEQGAIQNYHYDENAEYLLFIEILPAQVSLEFEIEQFVEEWYYNGLPYEVLDPQASPPDAQGVRYIAVPHVPLSSMIIEIYKYQDDGEGGYIEGTQQRVYTGAVNAGYYLFRIKASGEGTENYTDSEWVEQVFRIQKTLVLVGIRGKEIPPEEQHLYPDLDRYPLEKTYGDENPQDKLEIFYEGWQNQEDPNNPSKIPAGFVKPNIEWGELNKESEVDRYYIIASGTYADNYEFAYYEASFYVVRKNAEILVNPNYTTVVYTGTEQQNSPHFMNLLGPDPYEGEIPFAFSMNYNISAANFHVVLVAKMVYDESTGDYIRDESVTECVDVGEYIFRVSANQTKNYTAAEPEEHVFVVQKAMLTARLRDAQITYGEQYPAFELTYEGYLGKDIVPNPPVFKIYEDGSTEHISGHRTLEALLNLMHPVLNIPQNAIDFNPMGYEVSLEGGSADNYWINVDITANLFIDKKEITASGADRIIKPYDRTVEANQFVQTRHYKFEGVIHHYLKDSMDVVLLSSFFATFTSPEVGKHNVVFEELEIDNLNYRLANGRFECEGEITKITLNISLLSEEFVYDAEPKTLTPVVTGLEGDVVNYTLTYRGTGTTSYGPTEQPPTTAGTYRVTVTTNDPNYVSRNLEADMIIRKAEVEIKINGDLVQTYGSVTGVSGRAHGLKGYTQTVPVRYFDQNGQEVNITTADAGVYTAKAIYNATANYHAAEEIEYLSINPATIPVTLEKMNDYIYDGAMKRATASYYDINGMPQYADIKYALVEDGKETFINVDNQGGVISSIAPKNAGIYIYYAVSPSKNYLFSGNISGLFEITPRPVNIIVNDIVIDQGDRPSYSFTIENIPAGQSINDFETKPIIKYFDLDIEQFVEGWPETPGIYRIRPEGAKSVNYIISYSEGTLVVNAVKLVANTSYTEGLELQGSFSPDSSLNVRVIQSGSLSKVSATYNVFKLTNQDYKNTTLSEIYQISLMQGTVEDDNITVRLLLSGALRGQDSYKIAHTREDGSVMIIEDGVVDGEYLVFTVSELGNFSIIVEEDKSKDNIWIYLTIGIALAAIFIAIIIIKKRA